MYRTGVVVQPVTAVKGRSQEMCDGRKGEEPYTVVTICEAAHASL